MESSVLFCSLTLLGGADSDLSQLHTILLEIVLDKAERIFRKKECLGHISERF